MPRIDAAIEEAIAQGVFPGAALLVARQGQVVHRGFYGNAALAPARRPVTAATRFDIASLTKPVATASLMLLSATARHLPLDTPVARFLPDFDTPEKKKLTLHQLLRHTSGLPAWRPYAEELKKCRPEWLGRRAALDLFVAWIAAEPLEVPQGYKRIYSDLGFIVLGKLLETLEGEPLDRLFAARLAKPLGLTLTFFNPLDPPQPHPGDYAATGYSALRDRIPVGEVDDDNAWAAGGVTGHAGLFSHVDDLHRFLLEIRGALAGHSMVFPPDGVRTFFGPGERIKLGWDAPETEGSQAGRYFSKSSLGHLGFTGTSFWLDPEQDFHIILLTNRVHPKVDERIKTFRPQWHDLIYEEFIRP